MIEYRYPVHEENDRRNIINHALHEARTAAEQSYPYVARTRAEVEQVARDQIKRDLEYHRNHSGSEKWLYTNNMDVYTNVFVPVFVGAYLDIVGYLDSVNKTSTARLSVKEEEHTTMGTHSYRVTLTDMRYLKKPIDFIVSIADEDVKLRES